MDAATRTITPVLSVRDLSLQFRAHGSVLQALDRISFDVQPGEILSLVGESGCGKSVTAMAILGLLPPEGAELSGTSISLGGEELLGKGERAMRRVRGGRIGMIFQDPMTSLNPVHTIGMQIAEPLRRHLALSQNDARRRALELLDLVKIPDAKNRLDAYPHELSGGMRQRVMIAIALSCNPELLIADEPTTALDVTVQAQILDLINELKDELGMSIILITHDLGVVAGCADRMMVMYAGRIVEEGPTTSVFRQPSHGYTAGLLQSLPGGHTGHRSELAEIPGNVPRLDKPSIGCCYFDRCSFAGPQCKEPLPPPHAISADHRTACVRHAQVFAGVRDHPIVEQWS
ncbi:MAG: ABC transporter ATP-binding protein [Hyphomicrobiales bacterium]